MNVYKVGFGLNYDENQYDRNVASYRVLAKNAKEAIALAEVAENKVIQNMEESEGYSPELESIELVAHIDLAEQLGGTNDTRT